MPHRQYGCAWACAGHDRHIEVGPGEVRIDTLPIRGPNSFSGITGEPFGSLDGRMRLMYQVSGPPGDGARPVPPVYGISNTFTVVHVR